VDTRMRCGIWRNGGEWREQTIFESLGWRRRLERGGLRGYFRCWLGGHFSYEITRFIGDDIGDETGASEGTHLF